MMEKFLKIILSVFIIVIIMLSTQVFALDGYAVCFGLNEKAYSSNGEGADTTKIVTDARNAYATMGYTAYRYINPTFTRFQSFLPDNSTRMLESDIVLISGYASPTYMQVNEQVCLRPGRSINYVETNTGVVGIDTINWSDCKLVILMGCNTGAPHPNPELPNIQMLISDKGASTIGWIGSIEIQDCEIWLQRFNKKLSENKTIYEALNYANSYVLYRSDTIKNFRMYGNESVRLLRSSINSSSQNGIIDDESSKTVRKTYNEEINFNENDMSSIDNIIKQDFNNDFNSEDFEMNIYDNGEGKYTIDYIYKINDVYTDLACTIFIKNNRIEEISSNISDIDFSMYRDNIGELSLNYDELKNNAANGIVSQDRNMKINNQKIKKLYITDTGEKKVIVLSEYEKNGNTYINSYEQCL